MNIVVGAKTAWGRASVDGGRGGLVAAMNGTDNARKRASARPARPARRRLLLTVVSIGAGGLALVSVGGSEAVVRQFAPADAARTLVGGGSGSGSTGRAMALSGRRAPVSRDVTILSPRPDFMPINGQGPSLSGTHVVWAATSGEGATGSEDDRIFSYDLVTGRLGVAVRSSYGAVGLIGGYVLAGDQLAYVDTGFSPGGILPWKVMILDLRSGRPRTIAALEPAGASALPPQQIAPQIAFDGAHLLMVQTVNRGSAGISSMAILFSPNQDRQQVLRETPNALFADPALANNTVLWTTTTIGPRIGGAPPVYDALTAYDLTTRAQRTLPVGTVSQVAASGDLVVWKSGLTGVRGRLALYSLRAGRVLTADLAHTDTAAFPAINGRLVSWTSALGQQVQIRDTTSGKTVYSSPISPERHYGLTSLAPGAATWVYTVTASNGQGPGRGYVVVHPTSGEWRVASGE